MGYKRSIKVKKGLKILLKTLLIIIIVIAVLAGGVFVYLQFEKEGVPSSVVWNETDELDVNSIGHLTKKDGEDFRILLISDVQLGGFPITDNKALKLMDELVNETQPDVILTTGDNAQFFLADIATEKFVAHMEGYDIPWGVVLGNHDSEGRADRVWHGNQYEGAENSLFEMGPSNIFGVGNYIINIDDENAEPIYSLIMMDSNVTRKYDDGKDYDYIHADQIAWYEWAVAAQPQVPSMLIIHIPLPEFEEAVSLYEAGDIDASLGFGVNHEEIFCAPVNSGMFDSVKKLGSTSHIFCGHDHINSLSVEFEGVRLSYGLKTGTLSYSEDEMQGGTLITIVDGSNEVLVKHIYK